MAFDGNPKAENLTLGAGIDLSAGLHFGVVQLSGGCIWASDVASGQPLVLLAAVTSGKAVSAAGPGAVAMAKAGGAIAPGVYVTVAASGYFVQGSASNKCGFSLEAVSSGGIFALRLV